MRATTLRSFITFTVVTFHLVALPQESTRLLPESIAKTIGVQWKQDGRAIDLKLSNPVGAWVVTSALLEIRFVPTKLPFAGEFKTDKTGRMKLVPPMPGSKVEEYWHEQDAEKPIVNVKIQPGKEAHSVVELKFNSAVTTISILEARGREQTTIERLKSKVF
jgi:hypothetical protein